MLLKERPSVLKMYFVLFCLLLISVDAQMREEGEIILTAHGTGMYDPNRVVIPVHNGRIPPLPCVMREGRHEHGSTFSKDTFHYHCNNGTAEVIACLSADGSVIQLGRTFVQRGVRHMCSIKGDVVSYEQESMCVDNGRTYEVGDTFRNGSFKLSCRQSGIQIEGCFMQDSFGGILMVGESRIVDRRRHECQMLPDGRARYVVNVIGCSHDGNVISIGQMWTDRHVRYQCKEDGTLAVLGCIDEGLFVDLGRDLLMNGMVYRCYVSGTTTYYHKFACDGRSLSQCISNNILRARRF